MDDAGAAGVPRLRLPWTGSTRIFETAGGALAEIDPSLNMSLVILEEISTTAGGTGDKLGEPKAVELAQTVQSKLSEIEGKVQDANGRLGEVELRINGLLTTVNKLPGVQVSPLDVKVLDDFGSLLSDAQHGSAWTWRTPSRAARPASLGRCRPSSRPWQAFGVTWPRSRTRPRAQAGISAARGQGEPSGSLLSQVGCSVLRSVLTVALIWFALGQVGLFMWMWSVYRGACAAIASPGGLWSSLKRILAIIAMVLCTGVLLVCLAGAIGVWIARAPLTDAAVGSADLRHDTLQKVESTAGQVSRGARGAPGTGREGR